MITRFNALSCSTQRRTWSEGHDLWLVACDRGLNDQRQNGIRLRSMETIGTRLLFRLQLESARHPAFVLDAPKTSFTLELVQDKQPHRAIEDHSELADWAAIDFLKHRTLLGILVLSAHHHKILGLLGRIDLQNCDES